MGRRTGVDGEFGDAGDGVCGSGESESGAFKIEVVRDMSAEKGTEEASDISTGLAIRRWRRDGRGSAGVCGGTLAGSGWSDWLEDGCGGEPGLLMNLPEEFLSGSLLPRPDIEWLSKTTREQKRQDETRGESLIPPHWGSQV